MRRNSGFTLLETVIALAILALALMAIFRLNSGAVAMHAYTKRLTVATLLARSKMTDIEQELFDKGFNNDDDELDGDFSDEGWPSFKWRAKIVAPKTDGVPPEQLISAIFNIPMDGSGGGLGALFGMGGAGAAGAAGSGGLLAAAAGALGGGAPAAGGAGGGLSAMGPLAGFASAQMTQMVDQITKAVREVHLTVSWKDGKNTESIDLVTHVVSLGVGSDRNGGAQGGNAAMANAVAGATTGWMNPKTQQIVATPIPCSNNPQAMCDPSDPTTQLVPAGGTGNMAGGIPGAMPGAIPGATGAPPVNPLFGNPAGGILRSPALRPGGVFP